MKTTVLINCYNYEAFVGEAIRSVAEQTRRPDELIVVDDGSTDGSVGEIEKALGEAGFGRLVRKENGGQLSAFEAGLAESTGDWLFFLDADDLYRPGHIESVMDAVVKNRECDFFFGDVEEFGGGDGQAFRYRGPRGDLGYSALLVLAGWHSMNVFVGGVTSTLCVHRRLLERFLPLGSRYWRDWQTRADNVLVLGTSLAGARKYALSDKTVGYRLHGINNFAGAPRDRTRNAFDFEVADRLIAILLEKIPYTGRATEALALEFRGLPQRNAFVRKLYWRAVWRARSGLFCKLRSFLVMLKADLQGRG
jgi:glycosyltransferase involved in cell wall biosynthesis